MSIQGLSPAVVPLFCKIYFSLLMLSIEKKKKEKKQLLNAVPLESLSYPPVTTPVLALIVVWVNVFASSSPMFSFTTHLLISITSEPPQTHPLSRSPIISLLPYFMICSLSPSAEFNSWPHTP